MKITLHTMIRVTGAISFLSRRTSAFSPLTARRAFGTKDSALFDSKPKRGSKSPKPPKNEYAPTIILPETSFSQRANAVKREPEIQMHWDSSDIYARLSEKNKGSPKFVLHDGPPYANGDLHIGHALNKLLKDFINRYQLLCEKDVRYVPGWDCHGLPIELKVLQTIKSKERRSLTPVDLRAKAASFADEATSSQSDSFKRYGVFGDFDNKYQTLQPAFEAKQIEVFGDMYRAGYIYRGRKPVHWSPSSRTALAEAELEYPEGHVSKSIYVAMNLEEVTEALEEVVSNGLKVAIWTTTPWTMPANMAVAVNVDLDYCVVESETTGKLLVASGLVQTLAEKLGIVDDEGKSQFVVLKTMKGKELVGCTYHHPLYDRTCPVVEGGDYITTEAGTGLVHTAPGHGQEDYLTGLKNNLELRSPVDDGGRFTAEAGERFKGMNVLGDGNQEIIDALTEYGALLKVEDYGHKYPYDWRTKKPTIFRATDQWFASVEGFVDQALDEVKKVKWIPSTGENRINGFLKNRRDWCISRQRSWGVPIPVFYDIETSEKILLDEHTLKHIQALFEEHGSDCWWKFEEVELLPEIYKDQAHLWRKGTDTMDVWFDSGSSWNGVLNARDDLVYPADLYLEGSDQHRGWFQSSLLTSVASRGMAPYKSVLTHGFVLDEKGYKMSKSLGNVVSPLHVIEGGNNKKKNPAYGADVLRLWVASVDYTGDVCIGDGIIKQTFESYRKIRNTARYLLGNLSDFDPEKDAVSYEDLPSLDKWTLGVLAASLKEMDDAFETYQFNRGTQEMIRFVTQDLSNFYFDVAKDRIYISSKNDIRRRSCQTVLHQCLMGLMRAIAPVLPHMAEDVWQNIPWETPEESIFLTNKVETTKIRSYSSYDAERWERVRALRDDVNKMMDLARTDKLIGASLDAACVVYDPDESSRESLREFDHDDDLVHPPVKTNGVDDLRTTLMLSRVELVDTEEEVFAACDKKYVSVGESGMTVGVKKAGGNKCPRCWFYDGSVGRSDGNKKHEALCDRCNHAVTMWEASTGKEFIVD